MPTGPLRRNPLLAAVIALLAAESLSAQTSGNVSTGVNGNWSTLPWNITAGAGLFPTSGGIGTLNQPVNTTGTLPNVPIVTIDTPITLAGLVLNSVYQYQISGVAGNFAFDPAGFTLNVSQSNGSSPTLFAAGHVIAATLSGGGSAGLIKSGNGIVTISGAANTYTGGTHINGGILRVTNGDGGLGATGAGNGISMNGGTFRVSTTALTSSRDILLESGGGTIELFANATLNGIISGNGSLTRTIGSTLTLTGANTYTGSTTQVAGTLTVSGANGTIAASSAYDFGGIVNLDSSGGNNGNRLNDTGAITSRGMNLSLTGNAAAATNEVAGALEMAVGNTTLTVTANAAQQASLNFSSITRQNNTTLFVRGSNLGATPANGVAQITSATAPGTLVGGGGAAGTTNISILPWAVGNLSATATLGSSLVTVNGSGGFRPLATSEYAAAIGGNATDNVRITATTTAPAGTVNALLFAPAAAATLSGGTIGITSGALVYSPTATATSTISAGLDFGSAQGVIHSSNLLTISGPISGSNGILVNAYNANALTLSGASTYTGATVISLGQVTVAGGGTIGSAAPSPLGQTTAPIILNIGSATTRLWVSADTVFNRDFIITGSQNSSFTAGVGSTANFNITINGNVDLQRRLTIENGALPVTINGVVSGPGGLTEAFASLVVLNGANTYSGPTEINTGTFELGNDSAFGTGTVFFSGVGFIRGSGTAARTVANNFVYQTATAHTYSGTAPLTFTGNHDLNGGNRTLAITNTAGTNFAGLVSNGSITKTGVGTLSLTRAAGNTYTGGTVLGANAGILNVVNSSGSGTGSGVVSIGTGSTLAGSFIISGNTTVAGTLSPGDGGANAIGTANFGGNLTLSGTTLLEIAAAGSADRLNVSGLLTLGGTINIVSLGGYVVQPGDVIDLADWGTLAGTATVNTSGLTLAPGVTLDTSNLFTNGTITAVPEPTTVALLGLGGAAFLGLRRRRR